MMISLYQPDLEKSLVLMMILSPFKDSYIPSYNVYIPPETDLKTLQDFRDSLNSVLVKLDRTLERGHE